MPLHVELNTINQSLDAARAEKQAVLAQLQALNARKVSITKHVIKHASMMHDIHGTVLSEENIACGIEGLAAQLVDQYAGENDLNPPVFVSLMNGAMPFAHAFQMALSRYYGFQFEFITMETSSYKGIVAGDLSISGEFTYPIAGRRVFILDDIADTLKTGNTVKAFLETRGPQSVELVVLLDKKNVRLDPDNNPEYSVFQVDNKFLIGGGMDYLDLCRYLNDGGIYAVDLTTLPTKPVLDELDEIPALDADYIQLMQREAKLSRLQARCIQNREQQAVALDSMPANTVYTPGFFGVSTVETPAEPATLDLSDLSL